MNKKFLIMYITNASGHHSAALAIERAIKSLNAYQEVISIDGFGYTYPIMEKITHFLYMNTINKLPFIWDYLYDNPGIAKSLASIKENINKKNIFKIQKLIESQNCKVVITTQAFPCGMVACYKKYFKTDIKLIAVVTDFVPHTYWIYEEVDFYVVASEEAKKNLIQRGIDESKIKAFGIPIDKRFSKEQDKNILAKEFKLDLSKPVVLIMGGGRGVGPIKKLIIGLDSNLKVNILVVAGINKRLYSYLKKTKFKNNVMAFGFIDYVDKLMSVSDLLVSKSGGITTSEALAKSLPMLIMKPLPGQEQNNANFLLEKGVAEKAKDFNEAIMKICFLFNNNDKLLAMKEKSNDISKPFSSTRIAELAFSLLN